MPIRFLRNTTAEATGVVATAVEGGAITMNTVVGAIRAGIGAAGDTAEVAADTVKAMVEPVPLMGRPVGLAVGALAKAVEAGEITADGLANAVQVGISAAGDTAESAAEALDKTIRP